MRASRLAVLVTVAACAGWLHGADAPGKCVIEIGGKTLDPKTHAIVVPDKPTPQEDHAARDLRAHIEKLTGHALPLVADGTLEKQTPIIVGRCTATLEKLGVKIDFAKLGLEGIVIKTKGPALVLAGNKRGVLYAVYTFLEDYCNCRWFTPDCAVIPKAGRFKLADLNVRYIPPLEYRATDYPCHRDADFAVRNKFNGTQTHLDEKRGGKIAYSQKRFSEADQALSSAVDGDGRLDGLLAVHPSSSILDSRALMRLTSAGSLAWAASMRRNKLTGRAGMPPIVTPGGFGPIRRRVSSRSARTTGTASVSARRVERWKRKRVRPRVR